MTQRIWMFTLALSLAAGWGIRVLAENVPHETPLFYAGTLEENGVLVEGQRSITLSAWDAEKDGNMLCQSTTDQLAVSAGHFRMALADACLVVLRGADKPADVWIAVSFKDERGTPHDIPGRSKIGAVPYALKAERATVADAASGPLLSQVVPAGMIAMFAGACPAGWSEFVQMRGRVPRGEPAGNAGSLDNGGSDDAVVVSHTHAGMTAAGGDHTHAGSTAGESVRHTHGGRTNDNFAWDSCDIWDTGGGNESWQPAVYTTHYVGGNCSYRDKTRHAHDFATGENSADHVHALNVAGGAHAHAFTTADANGAVAKNGQNMQAFREVLFCIKL